MGRALKPDLYVAFGKILVEMTPDRSVAIDPARTINGWSFR